MIFLCVGTQLPFDRLVKSVDSWAENKNLNIFGQIGDTDLKPKNFDHIDYLDEDQFNAKFSEASLIISHAGMGTIISALTQSKPIIVLPRLEQYGEHRNDHQLATVRKLPKFDNLRIANSVLELTDLLDSGATASGRAISDRASNELLEALDYFISSK